MFQSNYIAHFTARLEEIGVSSGEYLGKQFNLQTTMEKFNINFADLCEMVQKCKIRVFYDYPRDEIYFDALEFAYFKLCETDTNAKYS